MSRFWSTGALVEILSLFALAVFWLNRLVEVVCMA
jgi:hypothetical protein